VIWSEKLGVYLINQGALSFVIEPDIYRSWGAQIEKAHQRIDMIVLNKDSVDIVELKETVSDKRKSIKERQISRYQLLVSNVHYKIRFAIYVHWKQYNCITGIYVPDITNVIIRTDDGVSFWAETGPNKIRREIDCIIKL